ncbi:serine/threonine-protein phosphatase 6 regulatory ankyrin repeat subunit B-like [Zootermopsis nevadensis]|nr:serine/threonine-protein phosphatase 6 regulatory ankyrin repeat subunit B-like [Zootermopsis nevadensis]
MEKFFNYINLNTSDELEIAFSEDARKQEESMENHVIETLELIIMHIEQEINANLPVSLRECLHICLRKLAESTHTLQELRVHELETELRLQTRSLRDHKIEILRMYNALSRKFWEEYAFKEQLYKAQEELNEEFLLRRKYEDMSLEFGRASDDVTLNIENHMKKHTQLSQSYEKLKIDYGKLVIKYNKIAKSEGECDEDRDQVVTGAQYNEGETEDELPITLSNLQMIMLLDSLKELKEVASNPSLTQPRGRKLMVETIERNKALDHGRRDLVAYVSTNPHLRCEKLEKVLTAYKKRYDYFWKGVFMDLTLSMFDATGNGCPLMTDLFLEYGERCSIVDKYQNTPLHYAAKRGNVIVGRTLIKAGSIVNHVNVAKITPLHLSLFYGHINFSLLLAHNGANLNLRDVFMNTPLHLATLTSNFVCMKMLLDKNVEVNAVDVDGDTPFLNCAITGNYELGSKLLGAGADITARNHVGSTAMHLAAWQGNMMFCKFLVDKLFPVGPINLHNVTPLHLAAMEGYTSLVELLIKSGATVNAVEDKTDSPLHYAAKLGNGEMAQALLTAGADVLARNFFEWTPLHSAASGGYSKVCLMLLIAESDINAVDAKKRTPLHLAVLSDDVSAVQLLVKRGADLKAVDCDQKTPCQLGYELEKLDIAIWLEEQAFSLYSKERKKKSREGRRGTPGSQS